MQFQEWRFEYPALVKLLEDRLGDKQTCLDVIGGYKQVMSFVWVFTAQLLGDAGTKAVVARSAQIAALGAPLLASLEIGERGVDFSKLHDRLAESDCSTADVLDAVQWMTTTIFLTLSNLTGNTITGPLLNYLEATNW